MQQLELPFYKEFKVGDKVKIISKSIGNRKSIYMNSINTYIVRVHHMKRCYNVDVFYSVSSIKTAKGGDHFLAGDLRRV